MLQTTVELASLLARGQYMVVSGGCLNTLHIWPGTNTDQEWLLANLWHLYDTDFECLVIHACNGSLIRIYDFGEAQRRLAAIKLLEAVLY